MTTSKSTAFRESDSSTNALRRHGDGEEDDMAKGYSKITMPLDKVKEKKFLSRPLSCKGVGFSGPARA